jgi:tumor protein p53-inducible protein 3
MQAIQIKAPGGPEQLYLGHWPMPEPGEREVLVKIAATALNRADSLQRQGKYPPPPGESPILGLEMSGTVCALGAQAHKWQIGDEVCGLLGGGGYAEYAVIHEDLALPVPPGLSLLEAAAIPEVFLTAYQALAWLARLDAGETALIHAGASGVGTAAIQLARSMGGRPIVTASAGKLAVCRELGAELAIDYRADDFAAAALGHTGGRGVDVVLDFLGAAYFDRNLAALRTDGRLVVLGLMGGAQVERLNLGTVLSKRLQIIGSTLRARRLDYKIELSRQLHRFAWPLFERGQIKPVIDSVFDWADVADAHRYMEENRNVGKIILRVDGGA